MIKYWITGVLAQTIEGETLLGDVAWSGHATKRMVPYTVEWTDGQELVNVGDGVPEHDIGEVYGYTSRRHANEAMARLLQRGQGFVALKGVSALEVRLVEYRTNGKRYLLDKVWQ